jgi:hypothetical protein
MTKASAPGFATGLRAASLCGWSLRPRSPRVDPPRELELRAEGELVGTGRWLLDQEGEVTTVRYLWDVHTTRPWMNLIAPVARPLSPGTAEG